MRGYAEMYKAMLNSTRVLKHLLRRADTKCQVLFRHVFLSCSVKKRRHSKNMREADPGQELVLPEGYKFLPLFLLFSSTGVPYFKLKKATYAAHVRSGCCSF